MGWFLSNARNRQLLPCRPVKKNMSLRLIVVPRNLDSTTNARLWFKFYKYSNFHRQLCYTVDYKESGVTLETKHIEIRHHFIRDCVEKKLVEVVKIHTDLNCVDLFTKAFDRSRFEYLVSSIGMLNPE
jgi:hypothetical protein